MSLGIFNGTTFKPASLGASVLPGRCWDKPGFKECHSKMYAQAQKDCKATGAVDFGGDQGKCIEVMTDAYAFNDCVPQLCPEEKPKGTVTVGPVYVSGDPCGAESTIRLVQHRVNTNVDGKWGPLSDAAYWAHVAKTGEDWYDIAKGCTGTGPYPRKAEPTVTPKPSTPITAPKPVVPTAPVPTTKKGISKGTMLAGAGIVAVLGVGGYYYGQKKGWF